MDPELKGILRGLSLKLRHLLEGYYDEEENWHLGDLERRLNEIGIWRNHDPKPIDELPHLSEENLHARKVVDAYIQCRKEAGVSLEESVEEFVRESAYTWANRLFALRCMEARGLIDEIILQKEVYGWRSLQHNRLASKHPELCAGKDDGLFQVIFQEFERMAEELPQLFNPTAPAVALRPSVAALKESIALLSGREPSSGNGFACDAIFEAPDAFGWAYQYWNEEEKNRVFEKVRTTKAKIEGPDIIPTTCIYTEPYMVKFLVQNSLGALWMGLHPESKLIEKWEYYVKDADRAPADTKTVSEITFLDPACGSGHFLLEAFDIFFDIYKEEGTLSTSEEICASTLNNNLFGIDIDERAVQISIAALWMRAKEKAPKLKATGLSKFHDHLIATNIWLPKHKDHLENFLKKHPEDSPLRAALEMVFEGLKNAPGLGSLLQIEEPVEKELRHVRNKLGAQRALFGPQTDEEWEIWKRDVVEQLKEHIAAEVASVDLNQFFFSRSAGQGLAFFNLLARRYDVVATNPPYLGSKNMGPVLKKYVNDHYVLGKRDLYAAFILRCQELVQMKGRIAMVTQQSWMFLRSFINLRAVKEERPKKRRGTNTFKGLLRETTLETLVHLGPGAFGEITGEVVNISMFTLVNVAPSPEHRLTAFRLIGPKSPEKKDLLLRESLSQFNYGSDPPPARYQIIQMKLLEIQEWPIIYWISPEFAEVLKIKNNIKHFDHPHDGMTTGNNNRFLRFHWEVTDFIRWRGYSKGGGYQKWSGCQNLRVDWGFSGTRIKEHPRSFVRNEQYYFAPGLTYSLTASGSLGVRFIDGFAFDPQSPSLFPKKCLLDIAGLLCSRVITYLLRFTSPGLIFNGGYVANMPVPPNIETSGLGKIALNCIKLKKFYLRHFLDELEYNFTYFKNNPSKCGISKGNQILYQNILIASAHLHTYEGKIDRVSNLLFGLSPQAVNDVISETGTPCDWQPLIQGYDTLPPLPEHLLETQTEMHKCLEPHERRLLSPQELAELKARLRALYEAGPKSKLEKDRAGLEDEEETWRGAYIPIPAETFLEELSQKLEVHPISIYCLLKEGVEQESWRCLPEERRITSDRFTSTILRLLGHRWPKQIETGEPVPKWADPDGIIPLTKGTNEPTLLDRVRERIIVDFKSGDVTAIEREFAEILGKSLEIWLTTKFFKHHTKQFKKRPIAWQLESRPIVSSKRGQGRRGFSGGVSGPAFSCIVYYHRLDDDALPKIRSQYVRPLRRRYETELRTLENIQMPTVDQTERRVILENLIEELKEFDAKLEEVISNGFDSLALSKVVAQEPLDKWTSIDGEAPPPSTRDLFYIQEKAYNPDLNDGVRVNIAPLQKAGLLASEVLSKKEVDRAIRDRVEWRGDERRWCREGKLPQPGWWKTKGECA